MTGIQRLEVLRDGAAAIYGTDAVAGVSNTITQDDFEGLEYKRIWAPFLSSSGEVLVGNVYAMECDLS
mgnify:CR=1 FL=1